MHFDDFALDERILAAVQALGFNTPTPIQAAAIPPLLEGKDMIGGARTGSGKTAAFGLPLLQHALRKGRGAVRALVLAPTRELALQVTDALRSYAENIPVRMVTVYGGASYGPQIRALRAGVPVVVGTPGRVIDHLERGNLDLSDLEMLVLDEADEMLRMGFIEDVEKVIEAAPEGRQIALFSATMPNQIRRIARTHLAEAQEIEVEGEALTTEHIQQRWIRAPFRFKLEAVLRILNAEDAGATLIFARTRASCAELADALDGEGISAEALHGDLSQNQREWVVGRLRRERIQTVVATDVAARGIDIDHITHVINFDLPPDPEVYVHRIGRTGRAGREGHAISLVGPNEMGLLRRIERATKQRIEQVEAPSDALIAARKRRRLRTDLSETLLGEPAPGAQRLVDDLLDLLVELEEGISERDVATAAIRLLAAKQGLDLAADPDARAPWWSSRKPQRNPSGRRDRSSGRRERRGSARRDRPSGRRDQASGRRDRPSGRKGGGERGHDPTSEAALFVPVGRDRGLRPADVVGLLTNEVGLKPQAIGRITILERKTFIGLPDAVVSEVLERYDRLPVRGKPVRIARAFERGDDGGGGGGGGGGREGGHRPPKRRPPRDDRRSGKGGPGGKPKKRWNRNR